MIDKLLTTKLGRLCIVLFWTFGLYCFGYFLCLIFELPQGKHICAILLFKWVTGFIGLIISTIIYKICSWIMINHKKTPYKDSGGGMIS